MNSTEILEIFEVYVPEDETLKLELDKHLSYLKRSMQVKVWHSREILPRTDWSQTIDEHMESARVILLLISEYFLKSGYSNGSEMKKALERHNLGEACVIPVLLRPVNWPIEPFQELQALPPGSIPVTQWKEQDEAFLSIAKGIQEAITEMNLSSRAKEAQIYPEGLAQQREDMLFDMARAFETKKRETTLAQGKFDVDEIAEWLRKRKSHRTVLLLGARAGKLFQNDRFYMTLSKFSYRNFDVLTPVEMFNECFNILNRGFFSPADIHGILRHSLNSLVDSGLSKADLTLAELIKQGYFDEIITTNIDDGLERALLAVGMREFEVVVPGLGSSMISYEKDFSCRIVKVRGDFAARDYRIGIPSYLDAGYKGNGNLKNFVQHVLTRDVLAIGIDPTWDKVLLRFLSGGPGTLWFVNEEDEAAWVPALLEKRDVRTVVGLEGSSDNFLIKLYTYILDNTAENPISSEYARELAERLQSISKQIQAMNEKSVSDVSTSELASVSKQLQDIQNEVNELKNAIYNLSRLQVEQKVSE